MSEQRAYIKSGRNRLVVAGISAVVCWGGLRAMDAADEWREDRVKAKAQTAQVVADAKAACDREALANLAYQSFKTAATDPVTVDRQAVATQSKQCMPKMQYAIADWGTSHHGSAGEYVAGTGGLLVTMVGGLLTLGFGIAAMNGGWNALRQRRIAKGYGAAKDEVDGQIAGIEAEQAVTSAPSVPTAA